MHGCCFPMVFVDEFLGVLLMSVPVCMYVTKQSQWLQGCYGPNSVEKPNAATALAVASKNSANG